MDPIYSLVILSCLHKASVALKYPTWQGRFKLGPCPHSSWFETESDFINVILIMVQFIFILVPGLDSDFNHFDPSPGPDVINSGSGFYQWRSNSESSFCPGPDPDFIHFLVRVRMLPSMSGFCQ